MNLSEEINTEIPPELYAMLKAEARRMGVCVETLCLSFLCQAVTHTLFEKPKSTDPNSPKNEADTQKENPNS